MVKINEYGEIVQSEEPKDGGESFFGYAAEELHRTGRQEYDMSDEEIAGIYNTMDEEVVHPVEQAVSRVLGSATGVETGILEIYNQKIDDAESVEEATMSAYDAVNEQKSGFLNDT